MLQTHAKDWEGKVRIIGMSLDHSSIVVEKHVEAKKWTSIEHYHIRNGKCQADRIFGVKGIPMVLLVDKSGTIVFAGHPNKRKNLEADIEALVRGEQLNAEGEKKSYLSSGCTDMVIAICIWIVIVIVLSFFDFFKREDDMGGADVGADT